MTCLCRLLTHLAAMEGSAHTDSCLGQASAWKEQTLHILMQEGETPSQAWAACSPSCSLFSREAGDMCQEITSASSSPGWILLARSLSASTQTLSECAGDTAGRGGPWEDPEFTGAYRNGLQSLLTVNT